MHFEIENNQIKKLIKNWLLLAISALALAGLYSLPPVLLRGSYFKEILNIEHIFATALVVHVDLSVLVWFLSVTGLLSCFLINIKRIKYYQLAFYACAIGAILISASPFIEHSNPIKNNYAPILNNISFLIGLVLFLIGSFFNAILVGLEYKKSTKSYLHFGIYLASLVSIIALICFIIASVKLSGEAVTNIHDFYEELFWGGGHILQFTFTCTMLVVWLYLAFLWKDKNIASAKIIAFILLLNFLIVIPSPIFYLFDNVFYLFTLQMRYGGGISAFFIGLLIVILLFRTKNTHNINHPIKACLVFSVFLFGYGGFLGYMISGLNAKIPAHYHGSIVAVTLSFMGLIYYLLPKIGYAKVQGKMANSQAYVYAIGQIMHITGLAWMGGYGALRKSAASSDQVTNIAPKLMFFAGGSLAILGGLLFIIVCLRSIFKRNS